MSFVDPKFQGIAYGMASIEENAQAGQIVILTGNDKLALNNDPAKRSFGILYKNAKEKELCTVFIDGGVYETDNFTGTIGPGDLLKVDAVNKNLTAGLGSGDIPVAEAISSESGVLRFKLLV